jgi:hypothetical protein
MTTDNDTNNTNNIRWSAEPVGGYFACRCYGNKTEVRLMITLRQNATYYRTVCLVLCVTFIIHLSLYVAQVYRVLFLSGDTITGLEI